MMEKTTLQLIRKVEEKTKNQQTKLRVGQDEFPKILKADHLYKNWEHVKKSLKKTKQKMKKEPSEYDDKFK